MISKSKLHISLLILGLLCTGPVPSGQSWPAETPKGSRSVSQFGKYRDTI